MRLSFSLLIGLIFTSGSHAISDEAVCACFDKINEYLGLDSDHMSLQEAQKLNAADEPTFEQFCSMSLSAMDRRFLKSAEAATVPKKHEVHTRSLQASATVAYPVNADVTLLYSQLGFTGNTFDRISSLTDRCDTGAEADDLLALIIAEIADEAAEAICGGDPSGLSCIGAGVTGATLALWKTVVQGCELQDGLVDGAEIEATFENLNTFRVDEQSHFTTVDNNVSTQGSNTRTKVSEEHATTRALIEFESDEIQAGFGARFDILDQTLIDLKDHIDDRLDIIEATLEARFDQVDAQLAMARTLLITPTGRRTAWNDEALTCDDDPAGNCATVAAFP